MRKQVLPHFGTSGLWIDAEGRTLVVGSVNDSTFVDAFDGDRFLGRRTIDCVSHNGLIAVEGRWLLLACVGSAPGVTVRLYRY